MNTYGKKPVMLYDGDCGFCRRWVERWKKITKNKVDYEPYQEAGAHYPEVAAHACGKAVHLITSDGSVYSGAHAVFRALAFVARYSLFLWLYEHVPVCGYFTETIYQWVARHRSSISGISKCTHRRYIK
jgi:predicted DCC family thiol-disulfide oxidoreductase YuxK